MVEERRPTKKVVKKVVRKTVARPAPTSPMSPTSPTSRRTAVTPPAATPSATSTTKVSRPRVSTPMAKLKARATTRPTIRIPSPPQRPGAGWAARARLAASRGLDRGRDVSFAAGRGVRSAVERVRDLHLPYLSPLRGAAITGVVVGLVAVLLGYLAYELFSATSGTTTGSGWKALAFVVVAFAAFAVGELLLGGFGIEHGRVISLLAIMLVLVLILTFFLDLAAGGGAWILVPMLGLVSFVASCKVIMFAADQPDPR